jgi:hypothetical protein
MPKEEYGVINVYKEDYDRFLLRKQNRKGSTLAGLFKEMLNKTEPQLRKNGKFISKEDIDE